MLLAVDVGNTNAVLGLFDEDRLVAHWRLETRKGRTGDEYAAALDGFLGLSGLPALREKKIGGVIIATVVPPVMFALGEMCRRHIGAEPLVVGPGIKTGMPILYENPREVGADRIVNAVAAYERWKQGCIIVDFGTATTFDVVTPKGEY